MKQFSCGDVVPDCDATFHGTEDEIMEQVGRHAHEKHGMETVPPELAEKVRQLIKPSSEPRP